MPRVSLTTLLDVIGLILVLAGVAMIDWRAGLVAVGVVVLAVSYALARAVETTEETL